MARRRKRWHFSKMNTLDRERTALQADSVRLHCGEHWVELTFNEQRKRFNVRTDKNMILHLNVSNDFEIEIKDYAK
jgi:hypothetical protein